MSEQTIAEIITLLVLWLRFEQRLTRLERKVKVIAGKLDPSVTSVTKKPASVIASVRNLLS